VDDEPLLVMLLDEELLLVLVVLLLLELFVDPLDVVAPEDVELLPGVVLAQEELDDEEPLDEELPEPDWDEPLELEESDPLEELPEVLDPPDDEDAEVGVELVVHVLEELLDDELMEEEPHREAGAGTPAIPANSPGKRALAFP